MSEHVEPLEPEPPELLTRNLVTAGHLMAGATAFFFLAFLFAYVYLRSLNSGGLWHPKGVDPPVGLGSAAAVLLVLCAVAVRLAVADENGDRKAARNSKLAVALGCGVASAVLQVIVWGNVGFGPADGGYASVFVGWTSFFFLFTVLALYWLETQVATALKHKGDSLTGIASLSFFWMFFAGIGILTWVVLYLISP
jgi:heme/copper-type cytochrome/quinol oxidase subunit 3